MPALDADPLPPPAPAQATARRPARPDPVRARPRRAASWAGVTGLSRTAVSARLASLAARRARAGGRGGVRHRRPPGLAPWCSTRDAGLVLAVAVGRSRSQVVGVRPRRHRAGLGQPRPGGRPRPRRADARRRAAPRARCWPTWAAPADEVRGVGMSLAGIVDRAGGVSVDSPALAGWDGVPLAPYLPRGDQRAAGDRQRLQRDGRLASADGQHCSTSTTTSSCSRPRPASASASSPTADLVRGHRGAAGRARARQGRRPPPGCRAAAATPGCLETVAGGWALVERLRGGGPARCTTSATWSPRRCTATGEARAVVRESGRRVGEALAATRHRRSTPAPSSSAATWPGPSTRSPPACATPCSPAPPRSPGATCRCSRRRYGERAGLVGCVRLALDEVLSPRARSTPCWPGPDARTVAAPGRGGGGDFSYPRSRVYSLPLLPL